eukprot:403345626
MATKQRKLKYLKKLITSNDLFGKKIGLNYKGHESHKTLLGGTMSIICLLLVVIYFIMQLVDVFHFKYTISTQTVYANLELHKEIIDSENLEFAFQFINKSSGIGLNLTQFNTFIDIQANFILQDDIGKQITKKIAFVECDSDKLKGDRDFQQLLSQNQILYCPQYQPLLLNLAQSTININFIDCSDISSTGTVCSSNHQEKLKILDELQVKLITVNDFFDVDEFYISPIKSQLNVLQFGISQNITNYLLFDMKKGYAIAMDSMFANFFNNQNYSYYTFDSSSSYTEEKRSAVYTSLKLNFDSETIIQERRVLTIIDALSQTGGIMHILPMIFRIIIKPIQEFLFYRSIFNKIYLIDVQGSQQNKLKLKSKRKRKISSQTMGQGEFSTPIINSNNNNYNNKNDIKLPHLQNAKAKISPSTFKSSLQQQQPKK